MGQPVRIYELAERMIRLAGFEPGEDIDIVVTGTRPGERLHEILFAREEPMAEIGIDGVMAAKPVFADRARVERWLDALDRAVAAGDRAAAERVFEEAIPEFRRRRGADAPSASQRLPRRHRRLPSEARERLRARDERAGEPLEQFLAPGKARPARGEQAGGTGNEARRGARARARRAATISGDGQRLGIGDDEGPPQRTAGAAAPRRRRRRGFRRARSERRAAKARRGAAARASGRGAGAPPCCPSRPAP